MRRRIILNHIQYPRVEQAIVYNAILTGLYLVRGGRKQFKATRESGSLIQLFVVR